MTNIQEIELIDIGPQVVFIDNLEQDAKPLEDAFNDLNIYYSPLFFIIGDVKGGRASGSALPGRSWEGGTRNDDFRLSILN